MPEQQVEAGNLDPELCSRTSQLLLLPDILKTPLNFDIITGFINFYIKEKDT
jgi:hypothetical protein